VTKLYDIDPGKDTPEIVRAIVEIPQQSANKYEYDGELGVFRLDRALYSPLHYPGDYGFIPGTLADDNDPLDVLVLVQQPSYPGVMIEVRPVGLLNMVDNDERDQKILAVPTRNPRYDQIHTMDQIFPHVRRDGAVRWRRASRSWNAASAIWTGRRRRRKARPDVRLKAG
jgi:inorganic pyrophosphatase